jgi:hypothetical protein
MAQALPAREVFHWPEFIALAQRLGIDTSRPTTNLTLYLPADGVVEIRHEYHGQDQTEADTPLTTAHFRPPDVPLWDGK